MGQDESLILMEGRERERRTLKSAEMLSVTKSSNSRISDAEKMVVETWKCALRTVALNSEDVAVSGS